MRDAATVSAMLCPVCKVGLAMSDRQGVEIDYCPQCRGVWLDRGELDKIIERSAAAEAAPRAAAPQPSAPPPPPQGSPWGAQAPYPPQPPHQGYGHGHHPYGYKKRRKSFLEELFD
jgi:Zn-finger nucleic acid-binding protein